MEPIGDLSAEGTIGAKDHDFGSAGPGAVVPHGRCHVGQNEDFFRLYAYNQHHPEVRGTDR